MYRHRSSDKITFFTVTMERKATCFLAFGSELSSPFNLIVCFFPPFSTVLVGHPPPHPTKRNQQFSQYFVQGLLPLFAQIKVCIKYMIGLNNHANSIR